MTKEGFCVIIRASEKTFETEIKMDENEIVDMRVVFKMTKGKNPECIAFLLDAPAGEDFIMSYAHVGQHSEASYEFAENYCRLASEEEYKDLREELESIGYRLYIREKINRSLHGGNKKIFHI